MKQLFIILLLLVTSCTSHKPLEDYKCDIFMQITKELLANPSEYKKVFAKYNIKKRIRLAELSSEYFNKELQSVNERGLYPKDCRMSLYTSTMTNKKILKVTVRLVFNCPQCPEGYDWPQSASIKFQIDEGKDFITIYGATISHT
jgi:hypothetical protein